MTFAAFPAAACCRHRGARSGFEVAYVQAAAGARAETVEFAYELARKPVSLPAADGTFAGGEIQAQ